MDFREAETYDRISSVEREDGLQLIDLVTVAKGNTVLDLGCGTGFLARHLADLVGQEGRVVAIDPNPDRLAIAKEKYSASNLQFLQGSAEAIPGGGAQYDLIFSNHVLHWCRDRNKAFANIARSLKSGGKLICSYLVDDPDYEELLYLVSFEQQEEIKIKKMDSVKEEECDVLVHQHNFKRLHKSKHECVHLYNSIQEYLEFFQTHWGINKKDIDMDAVHSKIEREGGLYFRYPILTVVMEKL